MSEFQEEEKTASVFSCKRSHTYSLRTVSGKLKYLAPGSHKPSPIWSPGLRVKKAANKDPSRSGWLCWPSSVSSLGVDTAQLWERWPSRDLKAPLTAPPLSHRQSSAFARMCCMNQKTCEQNSLFHRCRTFPLRVQVPRKVKTISSPLDVQSKLSVKWR